MKKDFDKMQNENEELLEQVESLQNRLQLLNDALNEAIYQKNLLENQSVRLEDTTLVADSKDQDDNNTLSLKDTPTGKSIAFKDRQGSSGIASSITAPEDDEDVVDILIHEDEVNDVIDASIPKENEFIIKTVEEPEEIVEIIYTKGVEGKEMNEEEISNVLGSLKQMLNVIMKVNGNTEMKVTEDENIIEMV